MVNGWIIPAVTGLILLVLVAAPVQAVTADEFISQGIMDTERVLGIAPFHQRDAQYYLDQANLDKAECERNARIYDERMRTYVQQKSNPPPTAEEMRILENPTYLTRMQVQMTGFHTWDPDAEHYWFRMNKACYSAEKNYNAAFGQTKEDDYEHHAEIFTEAAGVYDILGEEEDAQNTRDAAAVAEAHAAAGTYMPLPGWLAVLGVIGGFFALRRRQS